MSTVFMFGLNRTKIKTLYESMHSYLAVYETSTRNTVKGEVHPIACHEGAGGGGG
jgi:hypothetical protein